MYDSCKTWSAFNTVDEQLIVTDSDCNGHLESDITNLKENKHADIWFLSWSDNIQTAPAGKFSDSDKQAAPPEQFFDTDK